MNVSIRAQLFISTFFGDSPFTWLSANNVNGPLRSVFPNQIAFYEHFG